jgi:hypothetical protein
LFLGYFAIHCTLLVFSFRIPSNSPRIWLVRALLLGVLFDNAMLAIGPWAIDTNWYEPANVLRFILHVSVLPFLLVFAWSVLRACGSRISHNPFATGVVWIITLLAVGWGWWHEVLQLEMVAREFAGHMRFTNASKIPPIATIAVTILVLPMAAGVWRLSGWRWFFLGTLLIFLVNGASGAKPFGFMLGNAAEVVFIFSLLMTERFLTARGKQAS